jgi:hypothetical protein
MELSWLERGKLTPLQIKLKAQKLVISLLDITSNFVNLKFPKAQNWRRGSLNNK